MVEQPAWLFLKEGRVGMNEHCLLLFDCAVAAAGQACRVVKVTGSDGLWSRQEREGSRWERQGPSDSGRTRKVRRAQEATEKAPMADWGKKAGEEHTSHGGRGMFSGCRGERSGGQQWTKERLTFRTRI